MDLRGYLTPSNEYAHLSLRDLLEAREQFHLHLMRLPNVVATAVGRYRIRSSDSWPTATGEGKHRGTERRTLENSEVRPYSWPAILVFVEKWESAEQFGPGAKYDPEEMVPKTIYLADGMRVPVCVIEAPKQAEQKLAPSPVRYPLNNIGGGYPVVADVQGREYVATIACLVTDGHKTYALTNRHVTGAEGEVVYAKLDGKVTRIGTSSALQVTTKPFTELYAGWPGERLRVNVDAGLIDIDDLDSWTAQVRGLGTMEPMPDLSVVNVSLSLVGCHVRAHGAVGGPMQGEVQALFYRYKTAGGVEFVADLFIGPRSGRAHANKRLLTLPGDSGTLWLLEPIRNGNGSVRNGNGSVRNGNGAHAKDDSQKLLPIALQWGQNTLIDGETSSPQTYVLATFLSNVCSELSINLIRDWNLDQDDTWGAVGHFSIAAKSPLALSSAAKKLSALLDKNREVIGHDDQTILTSDFGGMGNAGFVPLADVPDFFWKHGHQGASRGSEGPNHFADMDQPRPSDGATLLDLCADPANIDPLVWNEFYDRVTDLLTGERVIMAHRGLLPFRVWQIFDAMIDFTSRGKLPQFVCAAGVLAHYVGDACQPLHVSYLFDGDPERKVTKTVHHQDGTTSERVEALGMGVHTAYEDDMVSANRKHILTALATTPRVKKAEYVDNGFEAAGLIVKLMRKTIQRLPPRNIVDAFIALKTAKDRPKAMWSRFGTPTEAAMKDGAHALACLWESAWMAGRGDQTMPAARKLTHQEAMKICRHADFLPSLTLDRIGAVLKRPA